MKIVERLEEIDDNIFATQSGYDIVNVMKNKSKPYRLLFDKNNRMYFIGDAYNYVHSNLLEAAYESGFYPEIVSMGEVENYLFDCLENEEMLLALFYPDVNKTIDIERTSDGYPFKYTYEFGTIYCHFYSRLEDYDIYKILGKPINKEVIEENIDLKSINERLENFLK